MGEEALAEVCPLAGGERTVPITVVIVVVVVVVGGQGFACFDQGLD